MRLEKIVLNKIKKAIHKSFGDVNIYLFGSRTDDLKKGGDIDIAIDTHLSRAEFRSKKVKFLVYLLRNDFPFKVDLVNYNTKDELLKNEIEKNFILL